MTNHGRIAFALAALAASALAVLVAVGLCTWSSLGRPSKAHAQTDEIGAKVERLQLVVRASKDDLTRLEKKVDELASALELTSSERKRKAELITAELVASSERDTSLLESMRRHGVTESELQPKRGASAAAPTCAMVLEARGGAGMVMISVGADDGVRPGHRFVVCRKDQFVALIEANKIFQEMASCRIVSASGELIRVNDVVRNRLR